MVFSRKHSSLWVLGFEISWRSPYQFELLKVRRAPVLYRSSGDGDSVGMEVAAVGRLGKVVDRLGAKLLPECATHKGVRVVLDKKTDRHWCPQCRKELFFG